MYNFLLEWFKFYDPTAKNESCKIYKLIWKKNESSKDFFSECIKNKKEDISIAQNLKKIFRPNKDLKN